MSKKALIEAAEKVAKTIGYTIDPVHETKIVIQRSAIRELHEALESRKPRIDKRTRSKLGYSRVGVGNV